MILDTCSWNFPGADRFMGDPAAAISSYNYPPAVTKELQAKISARPKKYDDYVAITKDGIPGYGPLTNMHFGRRGKICKTVDISQWKPKQTHYAMVFCSQGYCVALPNDCSNLSQITKKEPPPNDTPPPSTPPGSPPGYTPPNSPPSSPPYSEVPPGRTFAPPDNGGSSSGGGGSYSSRDSFSGGQSYLPGPVTVVPWYIISTVPMVPTPVPVTSSIPEPSSLALSLAGLFALVFKLKRTKAKDDSNSISS